MAERGGYREERSLWSERSAVTGSMQDTGNLLEGARALNRLSPVHPDQGTQVGEVQSDNRQAALRSALSNLIAQQSAMRTSPPGESATISDKKDSDGIMHTTADFSANRAPSASRTPEAIRSSRRLRQTHEALLASLNSNDGTAGAVNKRLQALQQRRRELSRALQHLEVVSRTPAPSPPLAEQADHSIGQVLADNAMDGESDKDITHTVGMHRTASPTSSEKADSATGRRAVITEEQCSGAAMPPARFSSSVYSAMQDLQIDLENTSMEADSFDALVQNLLRVSLSEKNTSGDGSGPQANMSARVYISANADEVGCIHAENDLFHPVFQRLRISRDVDAAAVSSTDDSSQPSGEKASFAELLRSQHRVAGLLRPQDLYVRAFEEGSCGRADESRSNTSEFQYARLCAAATLEKAHLLWQRGEMGNQDADTQYGKLALPRGEQPEQLPPLALALADSLRQSYARYTGCSMDGGGYESSGGSAHGDIEPWVCVHQCLESLNGAMAKLESLKLDDVAQTRLGLDVNLNDAQNASSIQSVREGACGSDVAHVQEQDRWMKSERGEDDSCENLIPDKTQQQEQTVCEAGKEPVNAKQESKIEAILSEAIIDERTSVETLSLSQTDSAARDGELEPFDTMNASTLATRSYCNSLDVSRIGAVPGTAEWSFRSSYEMSSVRGITSSDVSSLFDDDGACESVVEDDEEEDQDGMGIESEPHVAETDHRGPRSFLGCSALMTSHIDDAESDTSLDRAHLDTNDGTYESDEDEAQSDSESKTSSRIPNRSTDKPSVPLAAQHLEVPEVSVHAQRNVTVGTDRNMSPEASTDRPDKQQVTMELQPDSGSVVERTPIATSVATSSMSSGELQGLISAVNEARSDINRMAHILLATTPGDGKFRVPSDLSVNDRAALKLLAHDITRQSSLVHQLITSVADASEEGPLHNQAEMLKSLSTLLIQTKLQLEHISPQMSFNKKADSNVAVPNSGQNAADLAVPSTASIEMPVSDLAEVDVWKRCSNSNIVHPATTQGVRTLYSSVNTPMEPRIDEADGGNQPAEKTRSKQIPSQSLLQAALRSVLESSLLDVEAEINEWQDLQENVIVVDTPSVTLEDWKGAMPAKPRAPQMSELNSFFIPFEFPADTAASQQPTAFSPIVSPAAARMNGACASAAESYAADVEKSGMRYRNFVDVRVQDRVKLAQKVRRGQSALIEVCAESTSASCLLQDLDIMKDDRLLLEEYAHLSVELEHCMAKLPSIISAVSVSGAKTKRHSSANLTSALVNGATSIGSSVSMTFRQESRSERSSARSAIGKFCSSKDRAAMAESLATKAVFCSPLDRIALAQKLAGKTCLPESSLAASEESVRELKDCKSIGDQFSPTSLCELKVSSDETSQMPRDTVEVECNEKINRKELDAELLRAKAEQLQSELSIMTLELAAAARDFSHLRTSSESTEMLSMPSEVKPTSQHDVGVNTSVHQTVGVAVGMDDEDLPVAETDTMPNIGNDNLSLGADCRLTSSEGEWDQFIDNQQRSQLESVEDDSTRLMARLGGDDSEARVLDLLRDANKGVLDVSKMALQLSLQLSTSPSSVNDPEADSSSGRLDAACRSNCSSKPPQPLSSTSNNDVAQSLPYCTDEAERAFGDGEHFQEMFVKVVESVESLEEQVRRISEVQASATHGNQLLLEKSDGILDGVAIRLGELERGQGSIFNAVSELSCQISQVRTLVADFRIAATSSVVARPESEFGHFPDSNAVRPAQTQIQARMQAQMHAEAQTRDEAHTGRADHAVEEVLLAPSMPQPRRELCDLQELIKDLQHITAEIKSFQQRQVQHRCMHFSLCREETGSSIRACGEVAQDVIFPAGAQCAVISETRGGGDKNAQMDLSELDEMHEILSMLRQRAMARGDNSRVSAADTELDLSSFPCGPASDGAFA